MGRLPDFLIIGASKSGTSFLHELLLRHPSVDFERNRDKPPANDKEIHFFDSRAYERLGLEWYKSRFPFDNSVVTGEATPYYLFCPRVPARVHKAMPGVKLIAVLREPVSRAFSDYHHRRREGFESLSSFGKAIIAERRRIRGERERMLKDKTYDSDELRLHAYLRRGVYVDQLKWWHDRFPREQLLVLSSEDLFRDPEGTAAKVFSFLGLDSRPIEAPPPQNTGGYPKKMNFWTRLLLKMYFEPHNRRLYEYLGRDFGW